MSTSDWFRTSDGAEFVVLDEHVRGEPRWYYVGRRLPGETRVEWWRGGPEGSSDRRTARQRARRAADEHERGLDKPVPTDS